MLPRRLLLEEYGVKIEYIQGEKNIVVDALSRILTEELFVFNPEQHNPLHYTVIAKQQMSEQH